MKRALLSWSAAIFCSLPAWAGAFTHIVQPGETLASISERFYGKIQNETLLVVANLSRYPQFLELDLSEFAGQEPRELFGYTAFPRITDDHYRLSIGPHSTMWFTIETGADIVWKPLRRTL